MAPIQGLLARVRRRRVPHATHPLNKMEKHMNKTLAALALAAVLAVPAVSQAQDGGNFYVNGSVGQTHYGKSYYNRHHVGYDLNLGYRWDVAPGFKTGVEAGYVDLGSYGVRSRYTGIGVPNADIHGWTVGGTVKYDITPNWYADGRAGLWRWSGRTAMPVGPTPVAFSGTGTGYYAGVGFGYDFDSNWSLGLNYDYYNGSKHGYSLTSGLTSVSAEYRF